MPMRTCIDRYCPHRTMALNNWYCRILSERLAPFRMIGISPLQRVLIAAAGGGRDRAACLFALDNACAQVARTVHEPLMAQIRLAWWRDGLQAETALAQHRSPDMDAIRALDGFGGMRPHLIAMVDGWEELILFDGADADAMLAAYARGRGDGLFAAFGGAAAGQAAGGAVWALWDLAGHLGDDALAGAALERARGMAATPHARLPRMLAMMAGIARDDVRRGRGAPPDLTPRLYLRLLRAQMFGR